MAYTTRRNFGKKEKDLPEIDLTSVQRESWDNFLNKGIATELEEFSPIDDFTGKNWQLMFGAYRLGIPKITSRYASEVRGGEQGCRRT